MVSSDASTLKKIVSFRYAQLFVGVFAPSNGLWVAKGCPTTAQRSQTTPQQRVVKVRSLWSPKPFFLKFSMVENSRVSRRDPHMGQPVRTKSRCANRGRLRIARRYFFAKFEKHQKSVFFLIVSTGKRGLKGMKVGIAMATLYCHSFRISVRLKIAIK